MTTIDSVKEQIKMQEGRLIQAMQTGDVNALDELLHDDLLFVIPNGRVITKPMDLDNFRSKKIIFDSLIVSEQQISIVEDTVISVSMTDMKGRFLTDKFEGKFRYIRVWKSFNNNWKVIAGSGTQIF